MTHKPVLIFDLDGTLIDSAPSILASFAMVLKEAGMTAKVPLANKLIGPPLQETLSILTGVDDLHIINTYVESFKRHYDASGYKETKVYSGVPELLATLHASGFMLHLATNKRLAPTRLILDYLGWNSYFQSVYTLDLFNPRLPDKGSLLECLLTEQTLRPSEVLYIGDKMEDALSAEQNDMAFLGVAWGYGDFDSACKWRVLNSPASLLQQVRND
ncbi:HAD family hydrolase [Sulfuriferula sp. AH1]|uniref:HAD family hydrolase n=1 Tax=Sulfuriferula sp. AH1 TaxID=1985873 RepID=UPI0012F8D092|nr:HAD family hydrolase [Sulfuriferula sp. AH1]